MKSADSPLRAYGPADNRLLTVADPQPHCPVFLALIASLVSDVESCQRYLATAVLDESEPGAGWVMPASAFSRLLRQELATYVSCFHPERQPYVWPDLSRELAQVFVWVTQGYQKVRASQMARTALPSDLLVLLTSSHTYWLRREDVTDSDAAVLEQALVNLMSLPVIAQPDLGWLLSSGKESQ